MPASMWSRRFRWVHGTVRQARCIKVVTVCGDTDCSWTLRGTMVCGCTPGQMLLPTITVAGAHPPSPLCAQLQEQRNVLALAVHAKVSSSEMPGSQS